MNMKIWFNTGKENIFSRMPFDLKLLILKFATFVDSYSYLGVDGIKLFSLAFLCL